MALLIEMDDEDEPVARGLLDRLTQYKVMATIHCLVDVLRTDYYTEQKEKRADGYLSG